MAQLIFEWPTAETYAPADFISSESNLSARRFIDTWPDTNAGTALLSAPPASGKTHLAHIWASRMHAATIDSSLISKKPSVFLWQGKSHAVLENIHTITDEQALFHLIRHTETHASCLLLTSELSAKQLPFTLPDLRSRLMAMPTATIDAPDDALLHMFVVKCFANRQLQVSPEAIQYIVKRIERSFGAVHQLVSQLERLSSEQKKDITIALIKAVIADNKT